MLIKILKEEQFMFKSCLKNLSRFYDFISLCVSSFDISAFIYSFEGTVIIPASMSALKLIKLN